MTRTTSLSSILLIIPSKNPAHINRYHSYYHKGCGLRISFGGCFATNFKFYKEKILKYHHHTEKSFIDNMNNYCILMHADIPVLLFVYRHFTKDELLIHTKVIILFWHCHITCCALIYSHLTSPKKVKKSAFQHITKHH
jgi:hypothetical protein